MYNNLVYGKDDDPSDVQPRMTGLDQLSEHVSAMLKGSQWQTHSEEKQAAVWVWEHDGGKELSAGIDAGQRIESAAAGLSFDVKHEPDEQLLILFWPDEETHSFYGKDHMAGGLRFLRSELAYVAAMHPDIQDDWSETGLKALCLLAGEKL
ncbi:DNA-binding protein [Enterobacter cloacae]|uniref:DNA-binding protein n=1 Tax=Enterobacter cloacae TaxID=550 RepID=UPI002004A190|nr:DNA-binding protein [Enterobacter cloacae]MCK6718955.1 DNA-binding protein [Enterobacter cloacae]